MQKKGIPFLIIVNLLCPLLLCACSTSQAQSLEPVSKDIFAMDTYMTVTAYGSHATEAVDASLAEITRLDGLLSVGDENSEVYQINTTGSGTLSSDGRELLSRSLALDTSTGGLYDVAIYPLMDAWGFPSGDFQVPDADTLSSLLKRIQSSEICFDEKSGSVSFAKEGMAIDFGGIAKGYTSNRIMEIMKEYQITSGMVSLGGNVQLYGSKPDGSPWKVGIQSPLGEDSFLGILSASDVAVITSGGYERYFVEEETVYHHIIDPRTGYPANSGLLSVTIVSPDGTLADGLSTALYIMGLEDAVNYWRANADQFEMILMTDDCKVYLTEGLGECFSTTYESEVITK